jgi:hypothetical protein
MVPRGWQTVVIRLGSARPDWKVTMTLSNFDPTVHRLVNIILECDLEMVLTRDEVLASVETLEDLSDWAVKSWHNAQEVVYGI